MKQNFKKFSKSFKVAAVLALSLVIATHAFGEEKKVYKWKFQSHFTSSSPAYTDSVKAMIEDVKEATDGRLIIEPFPAGSLVPGKEVYNAVARGMVQMGGGVGGYYQNRVPLLALTAGLPYSFMNVDEALYFHDQLGFEKMLQKACEKDGILYNTDNIYGTEPVFKKPIRTLADLQGTKVRSYGGLAKFLGSLGATAIFLPGSEIYPALSTGVVEGAHWGAAQGATNMGFYEVAKYHMKPTLTISGQTCFLTNKKALEKLPADIQKAFIGAVSTFHARRAIQYAIKEDIALAKAVKDKGVEVVWVEPEEQKKFAKIGMQFWEEEAARCPECKVAVDKMKNFLVEIGHLDK